eukprot:jgi/Picsp_1/909/NSC_04394-R1_protein
MLIYSGSKFALASPLLLGTSLAGRTSGNSRRVLVAAESTPTSTVAIAAAGLALSPIAFWSEYTLATTGAGLPPGPAGLLGAAEGISYLAFLGICAWSITVKVQTGSGLPAGPGGIVGAAEGVSYLALLGAIVAAAYSSLT